MCMTTWKRRGLFACLLFGIDGQHSGLDTPGSGNIMQLASQGELQAERQYPPAHLPELSFSVTAIQVVVPLSPHEFSQLG